MVLEADKATVPIYYEGRVAKLGLNQGELPKIDEEFEAILWPSTGYSSDRWSTTGSVRR